MVANRGVGVRQIDTTGTTPKEHRLVVAGLVAEDAPNVPRSGLLNPGTPNVVAPKANMSYDVLPCSAIIARSQDEGVYTPTLTGITNVPTSPAPQAGSRWDLVWLKQNDPEKGDTEGDEPLNTAIVGVITGDAGASPVKPETRVPAGAMVLSEHQIFSGSASTNQSPNTSAQRWKYTAPRGVPIPVKSQAERDELSPHLGAAVIGATGVVEYGDGTMWTRGIEHVEFTGQTPPRPNTAWGPGTLRKDAERSRGDADLISPGADLIRLPKIGLYSIQVRYRLDRGATGATWGTIVSENEGEEFGSADILSGAAAATITIPNFYAWQPMNLRLRFRTGTNGATLTSRVRLSRIG